MKIENLHLAPVALAAAKKLLEKHPNIVLTSGRRTIFDQAHAMAYNIAHSGNQQWIAQTYADSLVKTRLQHLVDAHPRATATDQIAAGREAEVNALTLNEVARISKHLSGQAFDVQPVAHDAETVKNDIRRLPGLTKFLEREGGLIRWHAQF